MSTNRPAHDPPAPEVTVSTFLLLLRDDGRPESWAQQTGPALAGALLSDLAMAGRVGLDDDGGRIRVLDASPTGDPLLDEGLVRCSKNEGRGLARALDDVAHRLDHQVGHHLAALGVVRVEEVGLWRRERFPTIDPEPERLLRERLVRVLRGEPPTPADHAVLGVVHAANLTQEVFDAEALGMGRRDLGRRVAQVAQDAGVGAEAVDRAVRAVNAAVIAAILAAGAASS